MPKGQKKTDHLTNQPETGKLVAWHRKLDIAAYWIPRNQSRETNGEILMVGGMRVRNMNPSQFVVWLARKSTARAIAWVAENYGIELKEV